MKKATTPKTKAFSYAAMNGKSVDQLIATACRSAGTMKKNVQLAAVGVLMHAEKCGDYTKANELIDGLGHGVKRDSLVDWFAKYGGLTIGEGDKSFTGWKGAEFIRDNFQKAREIMWYECKKESPWAGFDMVGRLSSVLKQAQDAYKRVEKAKESGNEDEAARLLSVINASPEQLAALAVFIKTMNGEAGEKVAD